MCDKSINIIVLFCDSPVQSDGPFKNLLACHKCHCLHRVVFLLSQSCCPLLMYGPRVSLLQESWTWLDQVSA